MLSYSFSDVGKVLSSKINPYQKEMGIFHDLLPPDQKYFFHRMNIEHLQSISQFSSINNTLNTGFQYNIRLLGDIRSNLDHIKTELSIVSHYAEITAKGIKDVIKGIDKTNELLKRLIDVNSNPSSIASIEKTSLARQNIAQAKNLDLERAKVLLNESYDLLEIAIKESPINYQAYMEKGWLACFYKRDYHEAISSFDNAVMRSITKDDLFCVQALRHLAYCHSIIGNDELAVQSIKNALELEQGDRDQLYLELVEYLVKLSRGGEAKEIINKCVLSNSKAFAYFSTSPIVIADEAANGCLEQLYNSCKSSILELSNKSYKPDEKTNLVIEYRVNKLFSSECNKEKTLKIKNNDKEDLYQKFFHPSLISRIQGIDYIALDSLQSNEEKLQGFFNEWAEYSSGLIIKSMKHKYYKVDDITLCKKGFLDKVKEIKFQPSSVIKK